MANDVEHIIHMCIGHLHISLEKHVFKLFAHFKIRLFLFLLLTYKSCLYIFETKASYEIKDLQKFSPILWFVFSLS